MSWVFSITRSLLAQFKNMLIRFVGGKMSDGPTHSSVCKPGRIHWQYLCLHSILRSFGIQHEHGLYAVLVFFFTSRKMICYWFVIYEACIFWKHYWSVWSKVIIVICVNINKRGMWKQNDSSFVDNRVLELVQPQQRCLKPTTFLYSLTYKAILD